MPESKLIIDAGAQRITGVKQSMKRLRGRFMDAVDVALGDLLTDDAGRLVILGGFGKSQSQPPGRNLDHFANNEGWCDDTSDGPVRARLSGSAETIEADSAWVIVTPPDFAPPIENVVTLYDVVYAMMAKLIDASLNVTDASRVSFTKDIYPILRRVSKLRWVSPDAARGHPEAGPLDSWEVEYIHGGRPHKLRAKFLVDATGRSSLLARRQGARRIRFDRLLGVIGIFSASSLKNGETSAWPRGLRFDFEGVGAFKDGLDRLRRQTASGEHRFGLGVVNGALSVTTVNPNRIPTGSYDYRLRIADLDLQDMMAVSK